MRLQRAGVDRPEEVLQQLPTLGRVRADDDENARDRLVLRVVVDAVDLVQGDGMKGMTLDRFCPSFMAGTTTLTRITEAPDGDRDAAWVRLRGLR